MAEDTADKLGGQDPGLIGQGGVFRAGQAVVERLPVAPLSPTEKKIAEATARLNSQEPNNTGKFPSPHKMR